MNSEPKVALSVRQPWAWLIVNGWKDIENRDWWTRFRGRFFVHAGKQVDQAAVAWLRREHPEIPLPETFETGGIVGAADLLDCVTRSDSEWFEGKYGFVLSGRTPLPFRALRGQLGFFAVTPAARAATEEAET